MSPEQLLSLLSTAARLKTTPRHCFTAPGRQESVADHSWRLALFALLLSGEAEYADYDMDRVIRMCLIHDLGEAFTGDIPTFVKTEAQGETEDDLFADWVRTFPEPQRTQWQALLSEMNALETREARLYKALDKLEAVIAHNESDIATWLPLEYDLQLTHGREQVAFSPTLVRLKAAIDEWTKRKIEEEGERP